MRDTFDEQKAVDAFNQDATPGDIRHITTLSVEGANAKSDPANAVVRHDSYHHSSMLSASLYAAIQSDKTITGSTKESLDDKVVSGYTDQGLPFLIVVDGYYAGATEKLFPFIDSHVIPLISVYIRELQKVSDRKKLAHDFIKKIFSLRAECNCPAEFTLSLAVVYQNEQSQELRAAGFGVGDCGIVLRNKNGNIKQLVHSQTADRVKDGFDAFCSSKKRLDAVVRRSDVFDVEVERGDELLGYSHIPRGMDSRHECKDYPEVTQYALDQKAVYSIINSKQAKDVLPPSNTPLLEMIWFASLTQYEKNKQNANPDTRLGDDASFVSVKIATQENQQLIKTDFNTRKKLFTKISGLTENYQATKCFYSIFRNSNRVHQLKFIKQLSETQPSTKVMQGALLLVLFDIQHTQYAFTARGSDLRTIIIETLEETGITFKKDAGKLDCPKNLNLAESCSKLLDEHIKMYQGLKSDWLNNVYQEITTYFKPSEKPSNPLQPFSFR
jgi:hypothetical protein